MWRKNLKAKSTGLGSREVGNRRNLDESAPTPPKRPKMELTTAQLHPQTPTMLVQNENEALSPQLEEFCHQHPITVVSGLGGALKINLGLFSTKVLKTKNPDFPVEERIQDLHPSNENKSGTTKKWEKKSSWTCESRQSQTTIAKYAKYQAYTSGWQDSVKGTQGLISTGANNSCGNPTNNNNNNNKKIRFGTNIDLSDRQMWKEQLDELQKLPEWTRVVSREKNMLSHVGHAILGMNTVQLYMKVPECRTPGHQENNNFCSVNINIGPGDCEWFAVPDDHWEVIRRLCEDHNLNYLSGSWWPDLEEVATRGTPVYRFIQKPGDLVWVNSGCVHWVRALGCCNNVAWNVGPITLRQYQLAMERYEWNKGQKFQSLVPMVLLSWNLARENRITNAKLFESIKLTLERSLKHCSESLKFAQSKGVEVRFNGHGPNDAVKYCEECEVEVFNVLFTGEEDGMNLVYCVDCATKSNPNLLGFSCLEEYKLNELQEVYDNFKLPETTRVSLWSLFGLL